MLEWKAYAGQRSKRRWCCEPEQAYDPDTPERETEGCREHARENSKRGVSDPVETDEEEEDAKDLRAGSRTGCAQEACDRVSDEDRGGQADGVGNAEVWDNDRGAVEVVRLVGGMGLRASGNGKHRRLWEARIHFGFP